LGDGVVHVRPSGPGVLAVEVPGLVEFTQHAPDVPEGDVDGVGDVGGGERLAEFAPPLGDPAGGVAPSVDDLGLTNDGEVLSEGRRPRDDCRPAVLAVWTPGVATSGAAGATTSSLRNRSVRVSSWPSAAGVPTTLSKHILLPQPRTTSSPQ
jgi:hypothetical protein